jgi:peptide/nickel transport system ATP-binding protein
MTSPLTPVLTVADLRVAYGAGLVAVDGVSFTLSSGRTLALVGESGCGKSTIARTILGLHDRSTAIGGSILVHVGTDTAVELVGLPAAAWARVRGELVGYVAQDPFGASNPVHSVRRHVEEPVRARGRRLRLDEVVDRLTSLGITDAERSCRDRPHRWSGGMLQRATIAAATSGTGARTGTADGRSTRLGPVLVVADEPTSALDADRADLTIELLRERATSVLLISHDLSLVARHADDVAVLYAGRIVEWGTAAAITSAPRHPYTRALIAATPRPGHGLPTPLEGAPPRLRDIARGCAFAPRCPHAVATCSEQRPALVDGVACPVTTSPAST